MLLAPLWEFRRVKTTISKGNQAISALNVGAILNHPFRPNPYGVIHRSQDYFFPLVWHKV